MVVRDTAVVGILRAAVVAVILEVLAAVGTVTTRAVVAVLHTYLARLTMSSIKRPAHCLAERRIQAIQDLWWDMEGLPV
jgi:hypothetical protein